LQRAAGALLGPRGGLTSLMSGATRGSAPAQRRRIKDAVPQVGPGAALTRGGDGRMKWWT